MMSPKTIGAYCVKIALIAILMMVCADANAQFTIPEKRPKPKINTADTAKRLPLELKTEFVTPAQKRAERLALRKERNTFEINASLTLQQTQFENWVSGGDNTFSGSAKFYFRHQHKRKRLGFDSKFDALYGLNYIEKKMFKNQDKFQYNFLTTWDIHSNWSYSAELELRSQFTAGRKSRTDKTKTSTFMAPGYLKLAVGFTFDKAPFKMTVSPVGGNATFMLDDSLSLKGLNGVPKGAKSKWQVGPSIRINYDQYFFKKVVRIRSEVYSFTNIRTAPTVRWETKCEIQATKFLATTLYSLMQYDKTANTPKPDHVQYQYSIGVGLSYTFKNKK